MIRSIVENWDALCDEAGLSPADRAFLWGRQFLNPYVFEDLEGDARYLKNSAENVRASIG